MTDQNRSDQNLEKLCETGPIHLLPEGQVRFVEFLLNPPPLSPALLRARKAHEKTDAAYRNHISPMIAQSALQ